MFDLATLEAALAPTLFAGKLHFSRTTDSTNADALAAARPGDPHGSVYFADEQTAGRGRGDHGWHSAAGEGLYVSVLLRPHISATRLPLLPLAAGLAAADAIRAVSGLTVGSCAGPTICLSVRAKPAAFWLRQETTPKGCSTQWSALASTCTSAAFRRPGHPRNFARHRIAPYQLAPGATRSPAKIAAA